MLVYIRGQTHTLACALREVLEDMCDEEDFVACTVLHPLDTHLVVEAPSEAIVREALLRLKTHVRQTKAQL